VDLAGNSEIRKTGVKNFQSLRTLDKRFSGNKIEIMEYTLFNIF